MKQTDDIIKRLGEVKKEFVIDPSINLTNELDELVKIFKVKVISYSDDLNILTNLYFTMKMYFNDIIVDEIIQCCLDKSQHRELLLELILKNKN